MKIKPNRLSLSRVAAAISSQVRRPSRIASSTRRGGSFGGYAPGLFFIIHV